MKRAYTTARQAGALAGPLNEVVNQALAVARRVRRETALGSAAGFGLLRRRRAGEKDLFGSLHGKTVFLLGAGKMSELSARYLLQSGARAIFVSNRTYDRAVELASAFNGVAVHFDKVFDYLEKADIVISSTGAPHFVVTKEQAERLLTARRHRPIFFVDIAVPRDIDPAVNELDNAFV